MEEEELVLSCVSGSGGKGVKVVAWNPGKGAVQRTYSCEAEGGGARLAMLGKTHILCAMKSIPFIYVWHVRKEQVMLKMAVPGLVRALAVTPDSVYCTGAIAEKIYIWQVSTGHLLAVEGGHYQPVSVLLFTDDGQWLVSGGEDGRVLVWSLRRLLSQAFDSSGLSLPHFEDDVSIATRPRPPVLHHSWSDHALPVTALYCGAGGLRARLATASLDQTCKLYDLAAGCLLCSLLFGFSLTAVAMDTSEQWLFVGGATGKISRVNLVLQRMAPLHGVSTETSGFKGHTGPVSSLTVSGSGLVSGSEDGTCRVWDIASSQATRVLQMKGGVVQSLAVWGMALPGAGRKTSPQTASVAVFQKQLLYNSKDSGLDSGQFVLHRTAEPLSDFTGLECEAEPSLGAVTSSTANGDKGGAETMELHRLRDDMTHLRDVNRALHALLAERTCQSLPHTTDS